MPAAFLKTDSSTKSSRSRSSSCLDVSEDQDDMDDEDISNVDVGAEALQRMAQAIGFKKALPTCFALVTHYTSNASDWKYQYAALMSLTQIVEIIPSAKASRWRCRHKLCEGGRNVERGIRNGSFFEGSRIPLSKLVRILFAWASRKPVSVVVSEEDISAETGVDWYMYCRDVCSAEMLRRPLQVYALLYRSMYDYKLTMGSL